MDIDIMILQFTITRSDPCNHLLEEQVQRLGRLLELDGRSRFHLNLVLEEICANIRENNSQVEDLRIDIAVYRDKEEISLRVEDNGVAFDPTSVAEPDTTLPLTRREAGGLGLFFVRHYSNRIDYARVDGRNRTTVTMKLTKTSSTENPC